MNHSMLPKPLSFYLMASAILCFLIYGGPAVQAQQSGHLLQNLAEIKEDVQSKRVSSYNRSGANRDRYEDIEDGETLTLMDVQAAGIINHIWITIAPPHINRNHIILRMYWDNEQTPSVETPIGPFFGQGWNEHYTFKSMPLAVAPRDGRSLVSYFQMPFSERARIEIENQTGEPIRAFYYYIDYEEHKTLPENMGRFHAWYNREVTTSLEGSEHRIKDDFRGYSHNLSNEKNTTPEENYLMADIEGKGHFVGINYYIQSPTPVWYGEGDDMFFIDGEESPSLYGTGTEDYFNTAWVPKDTYRHSFFGYARQPESIGWLGRAHAYRFHITDPVYFDESLRFSIEHGHNNNLSLDLASVAYWYQKEPHKPFPPLPDKKARKSRPQIGPRDIHQWRMEWLQQHGDSTSTWGNP